MPNSTPQLESRRRIQLVLQRVGQLPTLSSVAVRLLEVTSSQDSCARDVVDLISADPSLASRVISLCRRASRGVSIDEDDLQRAVVLLGFDEVRLIALSVEVFDLMRGMASECGERFGSPRAFRPEEFWRHSLAVGVASQQIATAMPNLKVNPATAFLAGLLHDVGQLALYTVLPRTFDRVCELADTHGRDLDHASRALIGVGSGLFGKHVAERWRLPESLGMTIWLRGLPPEVLPQPCNHQLINTVTAADLIVRAQLITYAGHGPNPEMFERITRAIHVPHETADAIGAGLAEAVSDRAEDLGLHRETPLDVLRHSVDRAERMLRSAKARDRARRTDDGGSILARTCQEFFAHSGGHTSLPQIARAIGLSMRLIVRGHSNIAVSVAYADRNEILTVDQNGVVAEGAAAGWTTPAQTLTLETEASVLASVFYDGSLVRDVDEAALSILARMWGSAVGSAVAREHAAELAEQMNEVNRNLVETQRALAEKRTMASLGELASGAAHEMNNPLTVVSGRAQLLVSRLTDPDLRARAEEIVREAGRLSDLITGLRLSAEIQRPRTQVVDLAAFVNDAVARFSDAQTDRPHVEVEIPARLSDALIDPAQLEAALSELLQNAHEADPKGEVRVRAHIDPLDDRLMISVIDSGPGLSPRAREHAFDPFFSEKPAGRQSGLGLSRARRLVEINGGELTVANGAAGGAIATIALTGWRTDSNSNRSAA